MDKNHFLYVKFFCLYLTVFIIHSHLSIAFAQPSILDEVIKSQAAIVSITAQNVDIAQTAKPAAARDPRTGKIVILRNVKAAQFNRGGAGVIIHSSGILVTNAHTILRADSIQITFHDGQTAPAQVIKVVNDLDIALLKISLPHPVPTVQLADSDKIHLGDKIITVGNSAFLKQTVSGGKIIGIGTTRTNPKTGRQQTDLIQTTINVYQGDSGGPLFNHKGQLIGLMTAKEMAADHSS